MPIRQLKITILRGPFVTRDTSQNMEFVNGGKVQNTHCVHLARKQQRQPFGLLLIYSNNNNINIDIIEIFNWVSLVET